MNPAQQKRVKTVKSVFFKYAAPSELFSLFDDFKLMCNDAIRIAVKEKPSNRFSLIELAYPQLKGYGLHTHYILSACEVAYAAYRKKNRKSIPYVRKPFIKLDSQSYLLTHLLLRIPTRARHFIFLTLHGSDFQFSLVDDPLLKRGSVTITPQGVSIALSKEVQMLEPTGYIGIDINEKNVTMSTTDGYDHRFPELAEVVEIKEKYKELRAKIGAKTGKDNRIGKDLQAKYGLRERARSVSRIHKITKKIVDYATNHKLGIKMERLTGIRKLYHKATPQSSLLRGRMNTWVFAEIQRQITYKANWNGCPTFLVSPWGTSRNCPSCGSQVAPLQDRKLYCPKCDKTWDRDDLASKNIMACAVPQARPSKGSGEEERGDDGSNPPSRWTEVASGETHR